MTPILALTTKSVSWPANREAGISVAWVVCLTLLAVLLVYRRELARAAVDCSRWLTSKLRRVNFRQSHRHTMRERLELEVAALRDQLAQMEAGLGDAHLRDHSEGFAEMRASLDFLAQQVERGNR